ncbi:unnamed protein product [Mytilus edulis]|uniref:Solute carrier family 25 member 45 n=1 Tax=Mytilus edulis TaxID=6550 RepID=A0A8S3S7Z6_MYTED|nr:unnamed protein product [Mytilus edulis]
MADGIFHDFFGGLISGSAGVLVGHPFDTVKVQLQVQAKGNSYKNVWDCIDTIKKQSWSKGFFRGLSWPMLSAGVINSVFFGSYNQILKVMGTSADKQHDHPDYLKIVIASGMAGVFQLIIACPIEVIKVVLQSQIPHGKDKGLKFYKGPVEGVFDIVKHRGFSGMFRGLSSQLPRDVIASSIYFTVFEFTSYEGNKHLKTVPHPVINFMAGGLAGVVSWATIVPFDVLKSRMQADVDKKLYNNLMDCVAKTYQEGGIKIFYRGIGVICLRGFPVNAVTLMVYAEYMKLFDAKFLP